MFPYVIVCAYRCLLIMTMHPLFKFEALMSLHRRTAAFFQARNASSGVDILACRRSLEVFIGVVSSKRMNKYGGLKGIELLLASHLTPRLLCVLLEPYAQVIRMLVGRYGQSSTCILCKSDCFAVYPLDRLDSFTDRHLSCDIDTKTVYGVAAFRAANREPCISLQSCSSVLLWRQALPHAFVFRSG